MRARGSLIVGLLVTVTWGARAGDPKLIRAALPNGLRILLLEDHYAPVCSIAVAYNAGSSDETPGHSGLAHVVEHMMFRGSSQVGPGEHAWLIYGEGGTMNAATNNDRTIFYETVPANQLAMVLFLEADRMRSLVATQENLDYERAIIQQEHWMAVESLSYGLTYEIIKDLTYQRFPYQHSAFGTLDDLKAISIADVSRWHRAYYGPNNAALVVVGDFSTGEAQSLIRRYFEPIATRRTPQPVSVNEPEMQKERRGELPSWMARNPRVDMAYRLPPGDSPSVDSVRVLATLLGSGENSRLYAKLVREKQAALQVFAFVDERKGPSALRIGAVVAPDHSADEVETLILGEIARLQQEPVFAAELKRTRLFLREEEIRIRESAAARARVLADYTILYDRPEMIVERPASELASTASDIQRVARLYLQPSARAILRTVPLAPSR